MARVLGLDISGKTLRGVVARSALRKLEIVGYGEVALPMSEGGALYVEALEDGVRSLLSSIGAPVDRIVAALPGTVASMRTVDLPAGAAKRAEAVLPFELESLIPFGVEEAVIDHQPVRQIDGHVRLLAAAVPRHKVAELLDDLRAAGAEPRELAVGAAALDGLVPLLPDLVQPEPVLLLDLGEETTDLCVLLEGRADLVRTLSTGLSHDSSALATALKRTLASYRAAGGAPVAHAYVMGTGATRPDVTTWLGEQLGLSLEMLRLPDAQGADAHGRGRFGRAAALACRSAGRGRRIDLRKGEFAPAAATGALRKQAILVGACAAVVLLAFVFSTVAQWLVVSQERDGLAAELASVTQRAFDEETDDPVRARELLETGGQQADPMPRFDAYEILNAISAAIPDDIVHDTKRLHIDLDDDGHGARFEINGVVESVTVRDRIGEALEQHECITAIERGRTTPARDKVNYRLEGTVRCPGAPEPENQHGRRRRGR